MNDLSDLIANSRGLVLDSREVAQMLKMEHWKLLRKLEGSESAKMIGIIPTLTDNGIVVSDYFVKSTYIDDSGKKNKCYQFTKMGCEFIANKFTGEKGILFTAKYVKRFNEMETKLKLQLQVKEDFKEMTDAIKQVKENPKPYHFSNEINMINRIVLGCTSKEYKRQNSIFEGDSLREYLTYDQLNQIDILQKLNASMILLEMDFSERKIKLQSYKLKLAA